MNAAVDEANRAANENALAQSAAKKAAEKRALAETAALMEA